jgi:hypothetical protein
MKTSTKLLIIFFACIPASLWAYNLLLKKQVQAHNLVLEFRPGPNEYTEIKLPAFKHVIVNGALNFGTQNDKNLNWRPNIRIGDLSPSNTTNGIQILKGYEDVVKYHIRNDTLYVAFRKNKVYDDSPYTSYWKDLIKISLSDLQTVDASYGTFNINGMPRTSKTLDIKLNGKSRLDITGVTQNRLNLTIRDSSEVVIDKNDINDIYYNIPNKGRLTIDIYSAKHFHAGLVDSLAWINVQGKAGQVKTLLKP